MTRHRSTSAGIHGLVASFTCANMIGCVCGLPYATVKGYVVTRTPR